MTRRECPGCKHKALVTEDDRLSLHYTQGPGVGLICDGRPPSPSGSVGSPLQGWDTVGAIC